METRNKQQYASENLNTEGSYKTNYKWQYFFESFRSNQKLRQYLAVTAFMVVGFATIVVAILYQLIVKLVDTPLLNG
jgi:hypothetical protein